MDVGRAGTLTGLDSDLTLQSLKGLWRGPSELLAEVELPEDVVAPADGIHPALIEAAVQVLSAFSAADSREPAQVLEVERYAVGQTAASSVVVHARLLDVANDEAVRADLTLANADGSIVAELSGVRVRPATDLGRANTETPSFADATYSVEWRDAPFSRQPAGALDRWAVVGVADDAEAEALLDGLRHRGAEVIAVSIADLSSLSVDHVVCAWRALGDGEAAVLSAQQGLAVVQALSTHPIAPRLWWLTRQAVATTPNEPVVVAGSTLWGLGRTLIQEHPEFHCTLIDLDLTASSAEVLTQEARSESDENQIAYRND